MPDEQYGIAYGSNMHSFYKREGELSYSVDGAYKTTLREATKIVAKEIREGENTADKLNLYRKSARLCQFVNGKAILVEIREKSFHG